MGTGWAKPTALQRTKCWWIDGSWHYGELTRPGLTDTFLFFFRNWRWQFGDSMSSFSFFFRSSVQTFVFLAPFFFPGELWESLFWCDSQALFYCWTQPVAFWQEETQDEETPQTEEVAAEELPPVENKSPIPEPRKNPCRTEQSILNQISVGLP